MRWYLEALRKYAVFSGRARRQEYWMFVLINLVITVVLSRLGSLAVLSGIYALGMILPSLAVGVRRLHDTGRSGSWLLIVLVPVVGGLVLLYFNVLDSQAGENQYGPNPKEESADAGEQN